MLTVALSALASFGVCARSWCWTREPSWASTASGTSVGLWVTKKTPTPFERISRTVWAIWSRNAFEASLKSRCASSKKKTSLGLSTSPTSGRSWNRSASSHMRNVEKTCGRSWRFGSSTSEISPRPSAVVCRRSVDSNSGSPKNASAPWSEKPISSRRMTPAVAAERPPRFLRSALPSSLVRNLTTSRRSERSSSGRPGLVGVVEDQPEARLLGVVEAEHLAQQRRPERRHGHPQRDAGALPAERVVLDREARGRPLLPDRRRPLAELVARLRRASRARRGRP